MSIISRYLLKLHLAPFLFALGAFTGLMLINQIAKRFGDLVGKGLPTLVIVEVFALSVPFIVAMTLPMAVLVAVLYAVSRLAADNEITALRAGGLSLWRMLRPLLVAGVAVTAFSFLFSDIVLPRSNHRLRTLYTDIHRTKPTFSLREQVINEIQRNRFFLRVAHLNPATYGLVDVEIYDLADHDRKRIIYADSGYVTLTENQEDAHFTLFDGIMHEFDRSDPRMFQQITFRRDVIRVAGVGNELRRTLNDTYKGDREMGICEMDRIVRAALHDRRTAESQVETLRRNGLRQMVGLAPVIPASPGVSPGEALYCRALKRFASWLLPRELRAQEPPPREPGSARRRPVGGSQDGSLGVRWTATSIETDLTSARDRARSSALRAAAYSVELHKKYAIAVACVVFVFIGVPTAVRFPRGGVGLVLGISLAIFGVYYVGLIAGESLADRLIVPPWIMWVPNVVFAMVATALLARDRVAGTARGPDAVDRWRGLVQRFTRRGNAS